MIAVQLDDARARFTAIGHGHHGDSTASQSPGAPPGSSQRTSGRLQPRDWAGRDADSDGRPAAAAAQACDELTGVDVRTGGWDIRGRWSGVVIGATPRPGELRRGETIPWRVIAAQIALRERRGSR